MNGAADTVEEGVARMAIKIGGRHGAFALTKVKLVLMTIHSTRRAPSGRWLMQKIEELKILGFTSIKYMKSWNHQIQTSVLSQ